MSTGIVEVKLAYLRLIKQRAVSGRKVTWEYQGKPFYCVRDSTEDLQLRDITDLYSVILEDKGKYWRIVSIITMDEYKWLYNI